MSRTIVLSLPKAGTYLVSEILKRAGLEQTYLHVREDSFEDYRAGTMEERRFHPERFHRRRPLAEVAAQVPDGAFLVGHVPRNDRTEAVLADFAKLLCVRELRAALVSRFTFEQRLRRSPDFAYIWDAAPTERERFALFMRDLGAVLMDQHRKVAAWREHPDVLVLPFETMAGRHDPVLCARLHRHCATPRPVTAALMAGAWDADTNTKSPARTVIEPFWTTECEAIFRREDGPALNAALGYPAGDPDPAPRDGAF